jgi:hypothetical protein
VESIVRQNMSTRKAHTIEDFITEFQDIFGTKRDNGWRYIV